MIWPTPESNDDSRTNESFGQKCTMILKLEEFSTKSFAIFLEEFSYLQLQHSEDPGTVPSFPDFRIALKFLVTSGPSLPVSSLSTRLIKHRWSPSFSFSFLLCNSSHADHSVCHQHHHHHHHWTSPTSLSQRLMLDLMTTWWTRGGQSCLKLHNRHGQWSSRCCAQVVDY